MMYPMTYMVAYGTRAAPVTRLGWGLLAISVAVVLIIAVLILAALARRRQRTGGDGTLPPVERSGSGLSWVVVGTGISTLVLIASTVWTMTVLAEVGPSPKGTDLTIEVTGHQWWWEARYLSDEDKRIFTTANEFHIPTGRPVRVRLIGRDVIHSFWIPALTGKTDVIPGQVNETWIEARKDGTYRGQCTEYCGQQHANMAMTVVAEPPDKFRAWWDHQLQPAAPPTPPPAPKPASDVEQTAALTAGTTPGKPEPDAHEPDGRTLVETRCGGCHTVRGTSAGGIVGPDLTHLMSRATIAAGTLPNTPGYLAGWIADPQGVKPGAHMPRLALSSTELDRIRAYLETLR